MRFGVRLLEGKRVVVAKSYRVGISRRAHYSSRYDGYEDGWMLKS